MPKDVYVPRCIIAPFVLGCVLLLIFVPIALATSNVHTQRLDNGQSLHYLALGDSLAAGSQSSNQPETPFQLCPSNTNCGYVQDLFSYLQSQGFTEAKDLGCSLGETSTTFLKGGDLCTKKGDPPQLNTALNYLNQNQGHMGLVTLHIGADDLLPDLKYSSEQKTCQIDQTGFQNDLQTLESNLPQILKPLHDALNGSSQLRLLNYYNPFQNLCPETVQYVQQVNDYLATAIQPYGSLVDISSALNQDLCTYTGMCQTTIDPVLDIHPTAEGYQVIADAIEKVLNLSSQSQLSAKMYQIITATSPSATETNHVATAAPYIWAAEVRGPQLAGDFLYVEDMTVQQGDGGGLHIDNCKFTIYPNTQTYDLTDPGQSNFLASGTSNSIKKGLNVVNTIFLLVRGNTIFPFINGQQLAPVSPSKPVSGSWGVAASGAQGHNTTVVANKASVWLVNG